MFPSNFVWSRNKYWDVNFGYICVVYEGYRPRKWLNSVLSPFCQIGRVIDSFHFWKNVSLSKAELIKLCVDTGALLPADLNY